MAVGRRKRWQEGEGFAAAVAKTAANPDPIVVLIVGLFAPAPMTDDGILHANRAVAHNDFRARLGPIGFEGAPLATLAFPKIRTRGRDLRWTPRLRQPV